MDLIEAGLGLARSSTILPDSWTMAAPVVSLPAIQLQYPLAPPHRHRSGDTGGASVRSS